MFIRYITSFEVAFKSIEDQISIANPKVWTFLDTVGLEAYDALTLFKQLGSSLKTYSLPTTGFALCNSSKGKSLQTLILLYSQSL